MLPGGRFCWQAASDLREAAAFAVWCLRGKRAGDSFSFYKRHRLILEGRRYGCSTLVETGTYLGKTVQAVQRHFNQVLSVELSPKLYERAARKFRLARNVRLWRGDSGTVMDEMIHYITGRAIFWLDGHYSGGMTACGANACPLVAELAAIARHPRNDHVILIDDARCFGRDAGYPTLDEVRQLLVSINPHYRINVENDCITARPDSSSI
jgi:hypothetical protein